MDVKTHRGRGAWMDASVCAGPDRGCKRTRENKDSVTRHASSDQVLGSSTERRKPTWKLDDGQL